MQKSTKKILIYATTFAILGSSIGYTLCKANWLDYSGYITHYAEEIVQDDFLISAHRGFSSLEVENTKEAISLASEKGYIDYIEIDTRMTSDGKLVLSHNNSLLVNSEETQTRSISNTTYDQILDTEFMYTTFPYNGVFWPTAESLLMVDRRKNLNGREYHVVGLREGLECCGDKKVLLDLKFNNNIEAFCEELKRELEGFDTSNICFQSLNIVGIKYLQDNTNYNCQVLIDSPRELVYANNFTRIGLSYDLVTYEMIDKFIKEGKSISIWTINSTNVLDMVLNELGEHYKDVIYITDYPDLIISRLGEKQKVLTK